MIARFLRNIFFWTYERGSWQWDLSCLFFLLVIFTTPKDFLLDCTRHSMAPVQIHEILTGWLRSLL
jgi:hypothetical protein